MITYSWKRFTSNQINKLLNQHGSLWQRECYDHLVRDELDLANVLNYIIQNPVKAGLVEDWKDWHGIFVNNDLVAQ